MKPTSIATLVLAAASCATVATAWADSQDRAHREARPADQARLTLPQAATVAEVLGNGTIRELEWDPRDGVYEIKLATAEGGRREMRIDAYGGRVIEDSAR